MNILTYFLHYYIFYRHLELKLRKKNSRSRSLLSKTTGVQCKLITGGLLPSVRPLTTLSSACKKALVFRFCLTAQLPNIYTIKSCLWKKSLKPLWISIGFQTTCVLIKFYLLHLVKKSCFKLTLKQKLWSSL